MFLRKTTAPRTVPGQHPLVHTGTAWHIISLHTVSSQHPRVHTVQYTANACDTDYIYKASTRQSPLRTRHRCMQHPVSNHKCPPTGNPPVHPCQSASAHAEAARCPPMHMQQATLTTLHLRFAERSTRTRRQPLPTAPHFTHCLVSTRQHTSTMSHATAFHAPPSRHPPAPTLHNKQAHSLKPCSSRNCTRRGLRYHCAPYSIHNGTRSMHASTHRFRFSQRGIANRTRPAPPVATGSSAQTTASTQDPVRTRSVPTGTPTTLSRHAH